MRHSIMREKRLRPERRPFSSFALKAAAILFWLAVWQVCALAFPLLLASPAAVFLRLCGLVVAEGFWGTVGFTLRRIALGFAFTVSAGVLLAALSRTFVPVRALVSPFVSLVGSTPVAAVSIICLMWAGSRNVSFVIAALMAFPVLYTGVLGGLDSIDPKLLEMADAFSLRGARRFLYLTVSQVLPYFLPAAKASLGLCWKAGVAAEVIGIPTGSLGERLYMAKLFFNMPDLFAWTAVIILVSVACEKLFMLLLRAGSRWLERATCEGRRRRPAPSVPAPDIRIDGLSKVFGGRPVLRELSLALPAGSFTVLMGPSGCGKTTLFNLLLGFTEPDAGTIVPAPVRAGRRAACVFQEDRLIENLSAAANIQLMCPDLPRADVLTMLAALGLGEDADKPAARLSGGMRRRTALARALLCPSELLLLDEAFDGLDGIARERAMEAVRANRNGRTVLMITHSEEEAARMGGAVVRLPAVPDGRIGGL